MDQMQCSKSPGNGNDDAFLGVLFFVLHTFDVDDSYIELQKLDRNGLDI